MGRRLPAANGRGAVLRRACRLFFMAGPAGLQSAVGEYQKELVAAHRGSSAEQVQQSLPELPFPDAAAAQQELLEIVKLETTRLEALLKDHDEADELEARYVSREHSIDLSPEAERMRRYETRCMRYVDMFLSDLMDRIAKGTGGRRRWDNYDEPGLETLANGVTPTIDRRAEVSPTVEHLDARRESTRSTAAAPEPGRRSGSGAKRTHRRGASQRRVAYGNTSEIGTYAGAANQGRAAIAADFAKRTHRARACTSQFRADLASGEGVDRTGAAPGEEPAESVEQLAACRGGRRALERANRLHQVEKGLDLAGLKGKNLLIPVELS